MMRLSTLWSARTRLIGALFVAAALIAALSFTYAFGRLRHDHRVVLRAGTDRVDFSAEASYWKQRVATIGGQSAYIELTRSIEGLTTIQQHLASHAFGQALFAAEGVGGFTICDDKFGQGCRHELIGAAVSTYGLSSVLDRVKNICAAQQNVADRRTCEHGGGHVIEGDAGYTVAGLQRALNKCETVFGAEDLTLGCGGGVFMEYNERELQRSDEVPQTWRTLTASNIYSPCNELSRKYRSACMFWQPEWWRLASSKGPADYPELFKRMGEYCQKLGLTLEARTCFEGIGYAAPWYSTDPSFSAHVCAGVSDAVPDRIACWKFAAVQLTAAQQTTNSSLVCAGLSGPAASDCLARDRERWDNSPL